MDDLFDDLFEESIQNMSSDFLKFLSTYLPKYRYAVIFKETWEVISVDNFLTIDNPTKKMLLENLKIDQPSIIAPDNETFFFWSMYQEKLQGFLIAQLPKMLDPDTVGLLFEDTINLCVELFNKDRLLLQGKELLVAHKQQRDGKIAVLEKKYQDILVKNQQQNAEYSHRLQAEIEHQTFELKASNKALELAKEKAEAANIAKDKFLANMSHEIRTPMNGVVGMVDILLDSNLSEKQMHFAMLMKKSSGALLNVINDILDYSKIEAGKLDIELIDFNLKSLLEEISDIISIGIFEKKLSLANIVDGDVPVQLIGDPLRLRQVLMNFCGNSIKFTSEGEIVIHVSMLDQTKTDVVLKFEVHDTGIGISKDRMGILFQPFSQVDAGMTRNYGGSGLGLAISKQLVELMGGQIGADSIEKKGSTFWFILKFLKQARQAPSVRESVQNDLHGFGQISEQFKILLAEDDKINQIVSLGLLKSMNLKNVQIAENGRQAVEMFCSQSFDLILMDGQMPVMSGLEATAEIRAIEREKKLSRTPILALTAHAMKGDRQIFIDSGMDDYLTKPLGARAMLAAIRALLPGQTPQRIEERPQTISASVDTVIDRQELIEIMNGSKSLLERCIKTFLETKQSMLDNLAQSADQKDFPGIKKHAHRLKGALKYLAAKKAVMLAEQLEKSALDELDENMTSFVLQLQQECDKVIYGLESVLDEDGWAK